VVASFIVEPSSRCRHQGGVDDGCISPPGGGQPADPDRREQCVPTSPGRCRRR